jgi:cytochrome c-type biogenesis protein CcmH
MTIFWTLAAGLMLLAVLFVAAPLLGSRRAAATDADIDQERLNLDLFKQQLAELDADLAAGKLERTQYESARRDLERELLRDTASLGPNDPKPGADVKLPGPLLTAAALVFAIPAMALLLYWGLGASHLIPELELAGAGGGQQHAGAAGMPSLDILVQRLEERLAERPDDGEGWTMLGRTYFAMRRTEDAEQAFARAHELLPDDVAVTLAYAESIAANNQSSLEGKPAELVSAALAADPENATARWLAGMVAFQRGQYQAAATAWKRVLSQVDPASEDAAELKQLIDQAEQRAGVPLEMRIAANATADAAEAPAEPAQPAPADRAPANDTAPAPAPAPAAEPAPAPPAVTEPRGAARATGRYVRRPRRHRRARAGTRRTPAAPDTGVRLRPRRGRPADAARRPAAHRRRPARHRASRRQHGYDARHEPIGLPAGGGRSTRLAQRPSHAAARRPGGPDRPDLRHRRRHRQRHHRPYPALTKV